MKILKEVLRHEVRPSLGCTEPTAVALACSAAKKAILTAFKDSNELEASGYCNIKSVNVVVSQGIFKNGMGVCIPNTNGEKGNSIAAALGAVCGNPDYELEVLKDVEQDSCDQARRMVDSGLVDVICNNDWKSLRIEANVVTNFGSGLVVIAGSHTNVVEVRVNNKVVYKNNNDDVDAENPEPGYKQALQEMSIAGLIKAAQEEMDEDDRRYIKEGVLMNYAISQAGLHLGEVASQLQLMVNKGLMPDDTTSFVKILASAATDARMRGLNISVMSSGNSGNQGIVAILCPYQVGIKSGVNESVIIESIALSHLVNAYIKCFTGDLSPICGCAIATGVGAAVAIVYQSTNDSCVISKAINNVIADIGGILCVGAGTSCSLKVVSSVESAIRAAEFAKIGYSMTKTDGIVGDTPEDTIFNLGVISKTGMRNVDTTIIKIMEKKHTAMS